MSTITRGLPDPSHEPRPCMFPITPSVFSQPKHDPCLCCRRLASGEERASNPRKRDEELQHPRATGRQRISPHRRQVRPHPAADTRCGTVDVDVDEDVDVRWTWVAGWYTVIRRSVMGHCFGRRGPGIKGAKVTHCT